MPRAINREHLRRLVDQRAGSCGRFARGVDVREWNQYSAMPDDPNRPATKLDLDQLEDRLTETMRDMQTEVLRAFHDWSRPVELKLRALPVIEERLGLLEERISRIERGDKHA
jgi:hypothetical protein